MSRIWQEVHMTEAYLSAPLKKYLDREFAKIRRMIMALSDDLKTQVADLQAEDGTVLAALNDLLSKSKSAGSVSDGDVQAAVDAVKAEIGKLDAGVVADDPSAEPTPAPTPGA